MDRDFHRLDPEHFKLAILEAIGAISGTMHGTGHGDEMPHLTPTLRAAYEAAFAVMYNRGGESALAQRGTPSPTTEDEPKWLVWSNHAGLWWGPNQAGYRSDIMEAGRYTLAAAEKAINSRTWDGHVPPEVMVPAPTLAEIADAAGSRRLAKLMSQRIDEATSQRIKDRDAARTRVAEVSRVVVETLNGPLEEANRHAWKRITEPVEGTHNG